MRTVPSGGAAQIERRCSSQWIRVQIENDVGVMVTHAPYMVEYEDPRADAPIGAITITFRRGQGVSSLAPLMTVNPPIDIGRSVTLDIDAGDGSWTPAFSGYVDRVAWPNKEGGDVVVEARDLAGRAVDTFVEEPRPYGSEDGEPLEDVIQEISNDNLDDPLTVYTGTPTGAVVLTPPEYIPKDVNTYEAMRSPAESIGAVLRMRYIDAIPGWRLSLVEPERDKTVPDHTFTGADYYEVTRIEVDIEDIRNVIEVVYLDEDEAERSVTVQDAASITKYGRRYMQILEPADSIIRDVTRATALANAALSDLSEPDATLEIQCPYFWPGEVGTDLYRFEANGIHFSSDQDLAPVAIRHRLALNERPQSWITVRGKPSAGVLLWRKKAKQPRPQEPDRIYQISNVVWTEGETTGVLSWDVGAKIDESWLGYAIVTQPITQAHWDAVAAGVLPQESPATLPMPFEQGDEAEALLIQIEARYEVAGELLVGDVFRKTVYPKTSIPVIDDETGELIYPAISGFRPVPGSSEVTTDVFIRIGSPAGRDLTLKAWVNPSGTSNPDPLGDPDATYALSTGGTPFTTDIGPDNTGWSTATALLNEIPVWPGRGKVIYFEAVDSEGLTTGVLPFTINSWLDLIGSDGELIDGAIDRPAAFAASLRPLRRVATLPASGDYTGDRVAAEDTGLAWEWDGDSWEALTAADGHSYLPFVIANSITAREAAIHSFTAAHLNVAEVYVTGLVSTDNSPSAGSIAWSSSTVDYQGATYSVAAGNTSAEVVWWSPIAGSGTAFQTSSASSLEADGYDQNRGDRIILLNESGTARQVWNGTRIYGGHLTNDAIVSRHIQALVIAVSKYIESSNYDPGVAGWRIHGDGTGEFANVLLYGGMIIHSVDNFIDLGATGTGPILQAGGLSILANGDTILADPVDKIAKVGHESFRPDTPGGYSANVANTTLAAGTTARTFGASAPIPAGVDIQAIRLTGALVTAGNVAELDLVKITSGGTISTLATATLTSTSAQTITDFVTEIADATASYKLRIQLTDNSGTGAAPNFSLAEVLYTSANTRQTL